jgi:hypothetical protein
VKRAFYDFQVSPYSFDFAQFLLCARAKECTEVIIVPGTRAYQKCTPGEQEYRLNNLILGLCPEAKVCQSREEAKALWHEGCFPDGYTVEAPVAHHMLGQVMKQPRLHPFFPKPEKKEELKKDGLNRPNLVVITIRETHIKPARNSSIEEWIKAAHWMRAQGLDPVFVPDTENPDRKFGPFQSVRKAAVDVQYRLALYEAASLNAGVNNGPMALNLFSRRPLLYFRPVTPNYPESSEDFWRNQGVPFNSQLPWFTGLQRIIWEGGDDFENIKLNVERWLAAKDGRDEWPLSVAPAYPIYGVKDQEERHKQMAIALRKSKEKGWPQMVRQPVSDKWLSIVCYGPSLKHTWQNIQRPILTVSGAHDFLIERGIVPDFHMDCDPREYKAKFTAKPHKDVQYLMATVCHPKIWEQLDGHKVQLWHLHNGPETGEWVAKNDPGANMLGGGSTAGMRALEVGSMMGYRRFHIHGMDNSFEGEARHAGEHGGKKQNAVDVNVDGRWFKSSPQMIEAGKEMVQFIQNYDAEILFYGDGLQQAMVNHYVKRFRVVPMDQLKKVA